MQRHRTSSCSVVIVVGRTPAAVGGAAPRRGAGALRPVRFTFLGVEVQRYGVSKAAAALVAAWLLGRAFVRRALRKDPAHALVLWATVWGFVGAKVSYLLEQYPAITMHDLGGMGFTWYGGLVGGVIAALVVIRRHQLPVDVVAGAVAVPLTVAYGIGRLGCFVSGDGTYGRPTDLPWGMAFPSGVVATDVPVHPTPLYERSEERRVGQSGELGRRALAEKGRG